MEDTEPRVWVGLGEGFHSQVGTWMDSDHSLFSLGEDPGTGTRGHHIERAQESEESGRKEKFRWCLAWALFLLNQKCSPKQMSNNNNWQNEVFSSTDGVSIWPYFQKSILWKKELGNDSCVLVTPQHSKKMMLLPTMQKGVSQASGSSPLKPDAGPWLWEWEKMGQCQLNQEG